MEKKEYREPDIVVYAHPELMSDEVIPVSESDENETNRHNFDNEEYEETNGDLWSQY